MANGGGLMSIAASENLNPLEKFALGFLGTAEQNQRKRYEEEAKFVREKTSQIQERVTKQRGLYSGLKAKKQQQIKNVRAIMPGLSDRVLGGILRNSDETIEQLIKDARADLTQNRGTERLGKFLRFNLDGETVAGDATIFDPARKGSSASALASKQFETRFKQQREQQKQDLGQVISSFFGAATPTRELMNVARDQAMDLRGYSSGLSGDSMDARQAMDEFFALGGTASELQRKASDVSVQFTAPEKNPSLITARMAAATLLEPKLQLAGTLDAKTATLKSLQNNNAPKEQIQAAQREVAQAQNAASEANRLREVYKLMIPRLARAMEKGGQEEFDFFQKFTTPQPVDGQMITLISPEDLQTIIDQFGKLRLSSETLIRSAGSQ